MAFSPYGNGVTQVQFKDLKEKMNSKISELESVISDLEKRIKVLEQEPKAKTSKKPVKNAEVQQNKTEE